MQLVPPMQAKNSPVQALNEFDQTEFISHLLFEKALGMENSE